VAKNNSTKLWGPKNDNWGNAGHPIWGKFGHHHEVNKFMSMRFFLGDWSRISNLVSPAMKIMAPLGKQNPQT